MMGKSFVRTVFWTGFVATFTLVNGSNAVADETPVTREQFLELQHQNEALQQQLQNQQAVIDSLARKVSAIEQSGDRQTVPATAAAAASASEKANLPPPEVDSTFHFGRVNITGEGGLAFFDSQSGGQNPHGAFRIDEARLFLDAPVWGDVYFYSELDLATRESTSLGLNVGELYLDFEDVSQLWGKDRMLNVRAGRFYTPFGEEYLHRFAIDNPLISHSVSDIWGADDGVELYGKTGKVQYALAVQNGGGVTSQTLQDDKSVAGRVGYDPAKWLHLSASGMRTGNLNVNNGTSAIWFGNGFFRSLGSASTTAYHANLVEGDVNLRLPYAQVNAAGGYINYADNDPLASNNRDVYYYYLEGVHDFTSNLYSAARFSQVIAHNGFPIVGNGPSAEYLFGNLTSDYWRLSLAVGYRFNSHLLVKAEYSFNDGKETDGTGRTHENLVALEAAFRF